LERYYKDTIAKDTARVLFVTEQRNALWDCLNNLMERGFIKNVKGEHYEECCEVLMKCQRETPGSPEPEKPIILITVEGGVVQFVSANADVEVIVRDLDDQSERPVSTQSFSVDTLAEGELEKARAEIEQTNRDFEEDIKP
jgi:hypothetical protein